MEGFLEQWNSLTKPVKFLIVVAIWIALAAGYYFLFFQEQQQLYNRLVQEFMELRNKRDILRTIQLNLDRWKAEIARLDAQLEKAKTLLPTKEELASLVRHLDSLAQKSGLKLNSFRPRPERKMGFYAEVPISVEVESSFLELMIFLSKISSLDRIVTVKDLSLHNPRLKNQKLILDAQFKLVTYRYLKTIQKKPENQP